MRAVDVLSPAAPRPCGADAQTAASEFEPVPALAPERRRLTTLTRCSWLAFAIAASLSEAPECLAASRPRHRYEDAPADARRTAAPRDHPSCAHAPATGLLELVRHSGIEGPDTVEEGSTGDITVTAPGAKQITVTVSTTGETLDVSVGPDGKARFPLPTGARAGSTLLIIDADDPRVSTEIRVIPGTGQ